MVAAIVSFTNTVIYRRCSGTSRGFCFTRTKNPPSFSCVVTCFSERDVATDCECSQMQNRQHFAAHCLPVPTTPLSHHAIVLTKISGCEDHLFSHAVPFTSVSSLVPNDLSAGTAHTNVQRRNVANVTTPAGHCKIL